MPNIKSAKKRVLVIQTKTLRNKAIKTNLKTVIKAAEVALKNASENREVAVKAAMKKIDQAVAKGILHKNTAARKKSKMALKLNKAC
ncbi:MAG: 30S ribosomal protein S20 [Oscillospiraceae bacterium]